MPTFYVAQPLGYSIQTAEIDNLAVTAAKLAADAVETAKIKEGAVTEAKQTLADNTTADVSSTKHGYVPKSPADSTKFLDGSATPVFDTIKDSDLSTSDITTNNASTTKHGFLKKLDNTATNYMDGSGNWSVPAGSGKDIKSDVVTWATSFSTSSGTYVDVTNATITLTGLTAAKTYNIKAISSFGRDTTSGVSGTVALLIDGTIVNEVEGTDASREVASASGMKKSVTGATSYIAKLQAKTTGTITINYNATSNQSLMIEAIEL